MNILKLHCNDKPGVVAAVATALSESQCNIEESAQFNDHLSGQFFMRVLYAPTKDAATLTQLSKEQAEYIGVTQKRPFKKGDYRY